MADPRVREALGTYLERAQPEVLLLRAASPEDPLYGHRVVRMMFRIGADYLHQPIVIVDLTERRVTLEEPQRPQGEPTTEPPTGSERPDPPSADLPSITRPPEVREELSEAVLLERLFRRCCPRRTAAAAGGLVEQEFPPTGPAETAWRVRFGHATSKGLYITGAWFKKSPSAPWMRVLWDARLSDIFVPYHTGWPRYLDLTGFHFDLVPVTAADLGCCGTKADDHVVHEVRDRGVLWKDDQSVRRGHELVLWATLDADNYNYIIEYGFRDDGTITFRLGATARNLPGREMEAHMHDGLWRVDVDLGGAAHDSALLTRHVEPPGGTTASDHGNPFAGGKEGHADWEALEFTGVRVVDTRLKNGKQESIAYDLMPLRRGRARHRESFSEHDFWVTRYRPSDIYYTQLPSYVADRQSITDTDVVLWHLSPAHHVPRREDGEFQGNLWRGSALVMWSGFDLRPRNLFDRTPLFPY